MRITNVYKLPEGLYNKIVKTISDNPYNQDEYIAKGITCFRTTELIGPPLPRTLFAKYKNSDELVVDASFYIPLIFGTIFHEMCTWESSKNHKYECPIHKIWEFNGKDIAVFGTVDDLEIRPDKIILTDNKTCLVSNLEYSKPEYDHQVNMYLDMARDHFGLDTNNIPVELKLRYFVKDWTPSVKANAMGRATTGHSKLKAEKLPEHSIEYKNAPVYSREQMENIVMAKIADHLENPERICADNERYDEEKTKYAVMVGENKVACRGGVCRTNYDAMQYITNKLSAKQRPFARVELRPVPAYSRNKRCQYYCQVRSVCPYAKSQGYI